MTSVMTTTASAGTTSGSGTTVRMPDPQAGICPNCDRPIIDHDAQERKECHDAVSGFRRYLDEHNGIPPGFPDPWED